MTNHGPLHVFSACIAILSLALAGCSSGGPGTTATGGTAATGSTAASAPAQAHGTITLAYVEWTSCVAATNVAAAALEKAGYTVKTMSVSAGAMYQGLANGDVDAIVCAWLPHTHAEYYAKTKDQLVNLGANEDAAPLGLVVPDYVQIHSIADLKQPAVAKSIDNRIIGIDPGAGIMIMTHKVLKAYDLPEKLIDGSGATMTAALANAIRQHEPIVVTGWQPHWMWARWHLKFLADPLGVYGKPDNIDTLVRKGLEQAQPKAFAILKAFKFSAADRGAVMAADQKSGADPKADARKWVAEHPEQVNAWLNAAP